MRTTGSDKPKLTDKRLGLLGQMPEVMGFSQGGCRLSNLPRDVCGGGTSALLVVEKFPNLREKRNGTKGLNRSIRS